MTRARDKAGIASVLRVGFSRLVFVLAVRAVARWSWYLPLERSFNRSTYDRCRRWGPSTTTAGRPDSPRPQVFGGVPLLRGLEPPCLRCPCPPAPVSFFC